MTRVVVVGAGSWGTAVAALAATNAPTVLWARRRELADEIRQHHTTQAYLPEAHLPDSLEATADLAEAISGSEVVVMGVPSHGFREILEGVAAHIGPGVPIV